MAESVLSKRWFRLALLASAFVLFVLDSFDRRESKLSIIAFTDFEKSLS